MQKACGHPRKGSHSLEAHDFRFSFTPLDGVLFTFPSRYWFTIGRRLVLSLGGWAPRIQTGFHVSRPTWDTRRLTADFRARGCHPLRRLFPKACTNRLIVTTGSRNPTKHASWFGLVRVRSPLLAESRLISFPPGTEMFHFPGSCLRTLWIHVRMMSHNGHRIAPFGNPRIKGCLRLPVDYRGLPRPSSPAVTKAFIMRPNSLAAKSFRRSNAIRFQGALPDSPARHDRGEARIQQMLLLILHYCRFSKSRADAVDSARSLRISRPLRRKKHGGRAWTRTRDFVLIRDAL
jgi:hypothetical protein